MHLVYSRSLSRVKILVTRVLTGSAAFVTMLAKRRSGGVRLLTHLRTVLTVQSRKGSPPFRGGPAVAVSSSGCSYCGAMLDDMNGLAVGSPTGLVWCGPEHRAAWLEVAMSYTEPGMLA